MTQSLSRPGPFWDNAVAERWFGTYKLELIESRSWPTIAKLRSATVAWIESWYNLRRRHSTLGGISPANYENIHQPAATQAAQSTCPADRVQLQTFWVNNGEVRCVRHQPGEYRAKQVATPQLNLQLSVHSG